MENMARFMEFHLLKSYANCNLNRDEDGSPKMAFYDGVQRSRISSQCLKRNIRLDLRKLLKEKEYPYDILATRTRYIDKLVEEEWVELYGSISSKDSKAIKMALKSLGKSEKKEKEKKIKNVDATSDNTNEVEKESTKPILDTIQLYSKEDVKVITELIHQSLETGEKLNLEEKLKDVKRGVSLDIVLFGRMAATSSFSTVDGAMQVAHAMSTNRMLLENDYFTAVDDLGNSNSGSAHLNDVEFNSACYYEYFNLDLEEVRNYIYNLKSIDEADKDKIFFDVITSLIEVICTSHPSGKQNSFASFPATAFYMVEFSETKRCMTYSDAFALPVKASDDKNVTFKSIEALDDFVSKVDSVYGNKKERFIVSLYDVDYKMGNVTKCTLEELKTNAIELI